MEKRIFAFISGVKENYVCDFLSGYSSTEEKENSLCGGK